MRVVNTDNPGSDYPNERFVSVSVTETEAQWIADKLNEGCTNWSLRWCKVVPDNYVLRPGFEP